MPLVPEGHEQTGHPMEACLQGAKGDEPGGNGGAAEEVRRDDAGQLPGAGCQLAIISAWLVDNFDPKLAPGFATCKDAIRDVRGKLEEERRRFDARLQSAFHNLRTYYISHAQPYAVRIALMGRPVIAWKAGYISGEDREAVMEMYGICDEIREMADIDMQQRLELLHELVDYFEDPPLGPDIYPAVRHAMDGWEIFQRERRG